MSDDPHELMREATIFHDRLVDLYRETWAWREAGKPRPRLSVNRAIRLYFRAQDWRRRMIELVNDPALGDFCVSGTPAGRAFTISQYLDSTGRWVISAAMGTRTKSEPMTLAEYEARRDAA